MIAPSIHLTEVLKVLVDPTRLRILGLLEQGELSVGELARSLEMAQSRVSNHLRVLRDARILVERHVGRTTYLSLAVTSTHTDDISENTDLPSRLWNTLRPEIPSLPEYPSDIARLQRVLTDRRQQSRDFFDRMAGEWDKIGVDFATGQARHRAAAGLLPHGLTLADLGSGTGYMARALVSSCSRLICVDRSHGMLEEARRKLGPLPPDLTLELRQGELDHLPISNGEIDGCVAGMVLHHLPDMSAALKEMFRALKPGGRAVVLELAPHHETWMQDALGDRHLGLDSRDVMQAFLRAGFVDVRLESVDDRYQPKRDEPHLVNENAASVALPLYIVRGRVPPLT